MAVIAKKKLSEKVVDEIRKRIDSGELNIGDKLPNQNVLSQELGVSRTSLREAMNILDLLGVIEQKPGFGTVIRKRVPQINPEGLRPTLLTDEKTTKELLEARLIIETGTARLTAQHATKKQAQSLSGMVEQMRDCLESKRFKEYSLVDLKFHKTVADMSKNRFLREAFVSIKQHMELFITEHTTLLSHVLEDSQKHHIAICGAIADQDPERAAREMEKHIIYLQGSFEMYNKVQS